MFEEQNADESEFRSAYLSTSRDTIDVKDARKRSAFCIIRKKSISGYLYYLEQREKSDTYGGRLGLFGGSCEPEDASFEDALVREIQQELGVNVAQNDLTPQHTLITYRQSKSKMLSAIWRLDVGDEYKESFRIKNLKISALEEKQKLPVVEQSRVGRPVVVRYAFGKWVNVKWKLMTPLAAYCLLMDRIK